MGLPPSTVLFFWPTMGRLYPEKRSTQPYMPLKNWKKPPSCSCRSEEHTSELQSLMRISYAVFCLKKKKEKLWRSNTVESDNSTRKAYTELHNTYRRVQY